MERACELYIPREAVNVIFSYLNPTTLRTIDKQSYQLANYTIKLQKEFLVYFDPEPNVMPDYFNTSDQMCHMIIHIPPEEGYVYPEEFGFEKFKRLIWCRCCQHYLVRYELPSYLEMIRDLKKFAPEEWKTLVPGDIDSVEWRETYGIPTSLLNETYHRWKMLQLANQIQIVWVNGKATVKVPADVFTPLQSEMEELVTSIPIVDCLFEKGFVTVDLTCKSDE